MAGSTIADVLDAFLGMFGAYLVGLMLVAAEAGVAAGIPADMAGGAGRLVRSCQRKEARVIERRGFPCFW